MSYKSIIFFLLLFGLLVFCYFYYDWFLKFFPIHIIINFIVVLIGICGIFFPHIINKLKSGDDLDDIKEYIIKKYQKKNIQ
jgi:hypothetical protein